MTKLTQRDLIRFNFYIYFRRWPIRILTGIMFVTLIVRIFFPALTKESPTYSLMFPIAFLVVLPLLVYLNATRTYKTNSRVREQIEYSFTDTDLKITGESFNSTMSWDKVYKVTKTESWVLIWQTKYMANLIPQQDIWQGEIDHLKEILQQRGIKNNL